MSLDWSEIEGIFDNHAGLTHLLVLTWRPWASLIIADTHELVERQSGRLEITDETQVIIFSIFEFVYDNSDFRISYRRG